MIQQEHKYLPSTRQNLEQLQLNFKMQAQEVKSQTYRDACFEIFAALS